MSFKYTFSTLFSLLLLSSFGFASENELMLRDSVGIERVGDKSFIIHAVEAKETLFAISRRYQTPVGEIVEANESLKSGLKIGQQIRVPYVSKSQVPSGANLHKVAAGETLFAISKKYNVSVSEIMEWNQLRGNDLSVGQALIIEKATSSPEPPQPAKEVLAETTKEEPKKIVEAPKPLEAKKEEVAKIKEEKSKVETKTENPKPEKTIASPAASTSKPITPGDWISHEVQSGETLFSLSNRYNAKVEDLINWNALSSNNLRVGQVIKVGRAQAGPSDVPLVGEAKVVSNAEEMNAVPDGANSGGFKNIKETGQAELIEGTGSHKKYLVLHRTAPVGTIMRVKNEENDVAIFARVVGVLPETGDNSKLVIKLSQAAFDQLKAVNGRFPVEVMY
ncbi:LysM domain-containing protein [Algoriphagus faecimaris]|uniref:LysM domain-containing protein n=1 Tax=Algoriphagus faecimaris TaxID=686796 RepID=A0A1G6S5W5_9BACT|nr:LysM peptidoglycan-binding domain-containing protein [Algoriphagus faecimaris]SDD12074.1 LysM domain-containing protein [Algoriphagus faecimaris]